MSATPTEHSPDHAGYRAARRAYERGRLRSSMAGASLVVLLVALVGLVTSGRSSLVLLPLTFAAWAFVYWRGADLLRGAIYGLAGGVVTSLLPLSVLRPCCADMPGMEMTAACCTMPGACLAAGGVVGLLVTAVIPFGAASWWRTALGVALGTMSVAVLRCETLAAGEAAGLIGGLVVGVGASSAARLLLRRTARS